MRYHKLLTLGSNLVISDFWGGGEFGIGEFFDSKIVIKVDSEKKLKIVYRLYLMLVSGKPVLQKVSHTYDRKDR